jgi:hypothetical protein
MIWHFALHNKIEPKFTPHVIPAQAGIQARLQSVFMKAAALLPHWTPFFNGVTVGFYSLIICSFFRCCGAKAGPPACTGRSGKRPRLMSRSYMTSAPATPTLTQNFMGIFIL